MAAEVMGDKFSQFNATDAVYKTVDGHDIELTILTAKDLAPGKHPLILRFHGGFLVTGSKMYDAWFASWILDLALKHQAILITPNYRLLPESNGAAIAQDITSLMTWLQTSLPFILSKLGLEADLTSILTTGESAGGYLAVQTALWHPHTNTSTTSAPRIKIAVPAFGVLDIKSRFFTEEFEKGMNGTPPIPDEVLDEHLAKIKAGTTAQVVSAAEPPDRLQITASTIRRGLFVRFLGDAPELNPMEMLERRKEGEVPPMWIFHGRDDTVVPVEGSHAFADKLNKLHPSTDTLLTIQPGEHGFDAETRLDTPWLQEGLEFISKYWP